MSNVLLDHDAFAVGMPEKLRLEIHEFGPKLGNYGGKVAISFACLVLLRFQVLDLVSFAVPALGGRDAVALQDAGALMPMG